MQLEPRVEGPTGIEEFDRVTDFQWYAVCSCNSHFHRNVYDVAFFLFLTDQKGKFYPFEGVNKLEAWAEDQRLP